MCRSPRKGITRTTKRKDKKMIGNWIVTAEIGGLTYAWKFFCCTAQEAVFVLRRKYPNVENVKVEESILRNRAVVYWGNDRAVV